MGLLLLQDGQDLVFTYHNMLKSEAAIMQAIRELGPFDGICGFSQVGMLYIWIRDNLGSWVEIGVEVKAAVRTASCLYDEI